MTHLYACSNALRTTPKQCRCQCGGVLHGGPHTHRAAALVAPSGEQEAASASAVRRAEDRLAKVSSQGLVLGEVLTDLAACHMIESVVETGTELAEGVAQALGAIIEALIAAVNDGGAVAEILAGREQDDLADKEWLAVSSAISHSHIFCEICVAMLRMNDAAEEGLHKAVRVLVETLGLDPAPAAVLRMALEAVIDRMVGMTWPNKTVIQVLGIVLCPDIQAHPEVDERCVKPLAQSSLISDNIASWIEAGMKLGEAPMRPRRRR